MQVVELTSEQQMLWDVVRDVLLTKSGPQDVRRASESAEGFDRELWRQTAELGWFGLEAPAAVGGSGGTYFDTSIVLREIGRAVVPGPYLSHTLAIAALVAAPESGPATRWLERMVAGDAVGAAVPPTITADGCIRLPVQGEVAPSGALSLAADSVVADVPDAGDADVLVVPLDGPDGPSVVAIPLADADVEVAWQPTHDRTRRLHRVDLGRSELLPEWRVAAGDEAAGLVDLLAWRAATGIALDSVGGAARVVEMAVSHAKAREQFGRPIGTFQAVKHMCTDIFLAAETARIAADAAVLELDAGGARQAYWSAVAKFRGADAYARASGDALQIHGGIGMTWEFDLHLWLKRAKLNQALHGPSDAYRAHVARLTATGAPEGGDAGPAPERPTRPAG